jgi:tetratricopeptide (TPR) repeat protein
MKKKILLFSLILIIGILIGYLIATYFYSSVEKSKSLAAYLTGMQLLQQGKHAESIPYFYYVVFTNPDSYGTYMGLAQALEGMKCIDLSIREYRRAISLNTSNKIDQSTAYSKIGDIYYQQLEYELAIKEYTPKSDLEIRKMDDIKIKGNLNEMVSSFYSKLPPFCTYPIKSNLLYRF